MLARMHRRPLERMTFPLEVLPVDTRALADRLADRHPATIVGSGGQFELRFGDPSNLIAVISPAHVDFFEDLAAQAAVDEEEDPEHQSPEELSVESGAEGIVHTIEELLGLFVEDDAAADAEYAAARPDDAADRQAQTIVGALLERQLLELVTPRSRAAVEGKLAHMLAHGFDAARIAESLAALECVAELYIDDDQLAALLASGSRSAPGSGRRGRAIRGTRSW